MATRKSEATNSNAVLWIILACYFMIVLDISIVITAIPKIHTGLGFSVATLSWVQNAYILVFGGLLLLGARAGDMFGRRKMFTIGLGIFTLASLGVGLSQSPAQIICARILQGIGAAILAPTTLALLTTNFAEGPQRTRAVSYYAAIAGIGATIGLVAGGIIADLLSWRVGFLINIPIGIVLILAARKYLKETELQRGYVDVLGGITSTLGMASLVYGLVNAASMGWSNTVTIVTLVTGIILLILFFFIESKVKQPLIPLRLFANSERSGAYAARLLFLGAMVSFWFFTTQFLQDVKGYSPLLAGLAFLPTTLPNFAAAMAVPKLTHRFGNGKILAFGLFMTTIGMIWLSQLTADSSYIIGVALPMILIGIGQGISLGPLTASGIAGVSSQDAGAASGVVNVAHQLGGSLGLGILIVVFASASSSLTGSALLAHRIGAAFLGGSIMLAVALVIVLLFIVRKSKAHEVNLLEVSE